jgi:PleD family two-component response regulator
VIDVERENSPKPGGENHKPAADPAEEFLVFFGLQKRPELIQPGLVPVQKRTAFKYIPRNLASQGQQNLPVNTAFTLIAHHAAEWAVTPMGGRMSARIPIATADPVQRRLLETLVHQFGYQAESVETGEAMLARLQSPGAPAIGLASLDLVMPDLDGMTARARLWEAGKTLPIIFETS